VTVTATATATRPPGTRRCGATIATRHSGTAIASAPANVATDASSAPAVTAVVQPAVRTMAAPAKWARCCASVPPSSARRVANIQVGSMITAAASSRAGPRAEPHKVINDELYTSKRVLINSAAPTAAHHPEPVRSISISVRCALPP